MLDMSDKPMANSCPDHDHASGRRPRLPDEKSEDGRELHPLEPIFSLEQVTQKHARQRPADQQQVANKKSADETKFSLRTGERSGRPRNEIPERSGEQHEQ